MSDNQERPAGLPLGPSETPFEAAATLFGMYAPKFEEQLKQLTTGELRRVLNALVQYPLNEKEFLTDSQRVRTAFALGQALLEAKWVMIMQSVMDQEQQKLRENEETQTTNEEEKEKANG